MNGCVAHYGSYTNKCSVCRASVEGHNGLHGKKCNNLPVSKHVVSISSTTSSTNNVNHNNLLVLQANIGSPSVDSTSAQNNMITVTYGSSVIQPVPQQVFVRMSYEDQPNVNFNSGLTLPNNVHFVTSGQQSTAVDKIL